MVNQEQLSRYLFQRYKKGKSEKIHIIWELYCEGKYSCVLFLWFTRFADRIFDFFELFKLTFALSLLWYVSLNMEQSEAHSLTFCCWPKRVNVANAHFSPGWHNIFVPVHPSAPICVSHCSHCTPDPPGLGLGESLPHFTYIKSIWLLKLTFQVRSC